MSCEHSVVWTLEAAELAKLFEEHRRREVLLFFRVDALWLVEGWPRTVVSLRERSLDATSCVRLPARCSGLPKPSMQAQLAPASQETR